MILWFKPDVAVPENAEVMWDYAPNKPGQARTGTQWLTQDNVVALGDTTTASAALPVTVVPEAEGEQGDWEVEIVADAEPPAPAPAPVAEPRPDPYLPLIDQIAVANRPENQTAFQQALLNYPSLLPLDEEYANQFDREIVEAKRDRYLAAVQRAQGSSRLPPLNPITLVQQHLVAKGDMIDELRRQEAYIGEQQLLARLHERRLAGEPVTELEELDYRPHVRDDVELDRDYADVTYGRYIWQLFPHVEGDEDVLVADRQFGDLPAYKDPLASVLLRHERALPLHKKLEREIYDGVAGRLAVQKKVEDAAAGKEWVVA
eukprot:TRINITY_DN9971_c0_g1_i1.p1 TRINITY_DN9971_c0_g1~~TRINITY_DN9971_c0_g1_i1.p1  ORF type:complete len:318 (+),score=83.76 TRINITY_DN9971_c0_g1_i1:681-1634(+)